MGDISVIGLGLMGSALARSLINSGHKVSVWNRSSAKVQQLVDLGAERSLNFAAAIAASPVALVCVDNYRTTRMLLASAEISPLLKGRTVVQLSTGTPKEAREAASWFAALGVDYLDGGILGGPAGIGTSRVTILYSGSRDAFERYESMLVSFGENLRFVGEDPGAAAALDFAWLINRYGIYLSAAHGAMLCAAEGVDLGLLADVFAVNDPARWVIDVIKAENFENPMATLSVWNAALRLIQEQGKDSGIGSEVPDFVAGILNRAEAAGYGQQHIAAVVKVLRDVSGSSHYWTP